MIFNKTEREEKKYLRKILKKIDEEISLINQRIQSQSDEVKYLKNHLFEHKRDMDHLEKNAMREAITNNSLLGEHSVAKRKRLLRLKNVPYFGRVDFLENNKNKCLPVYIGVNNLFDEANKKNLIYDWRAPISSLFYDFETGKANYKTESKKVEGSIELKRQFRIRNGNMEYMFDSELTIQDDVLQKELQQASSSKMKNIVATIQREQNEIIRNEDARHLIIQGVAGSGKTSIALHRIAFLLYRFKETISSSDILIISPNKVFASYISNVLPELGEETIKETSMEEIADRILDYRIKFQSFFDQVSEILSKNDEAYIKRIQFKSSPELLKKMDEYLLFLENDGFKATDIMVGRKPVPAWFIKESFQKFNRKPILKRFNEVVNEIVNNVFFYYQYEITGKERTQLHATIRKMFPSVNLRMLYKNFYNWIDKPELLKMRKAATYEYSDVYPLIYLKMKTEGLKAFEEVKHLVIDEMQDYSPIQYKILSTLFPCKKTILGDINQSVTPFSSSNPDTIKSIFTESIGISMLKSYRSTYEITQFSKKIRKSINIEAVERHGERPKVYKCKSAKDELEKINKLLIEFKESEFNSLGIICKTQLQAEKLYMQLKEKFTLSFLDSTSIAFGSGMTITTAHLAKGLEFDSVLVPYATEKNYNTETDRQMLYVACTRAMHRLNLSCYGKTSSFISVEETEKK